MCRKGDGAEAGQSVNLPVRAGMAGMVLPWGKRKVLLLQLF